MAHVSPTPERPPEPVHLLRRIVVVSVLALLAAAGWWIGTTLRG